MKVKCWFTTSNPSGIFADGKGLCAIFLSVINVVHMDVVNGVIWDLVGRPHCSLPAFFILILLFTPVLLLAGEAGTPVCPSPSQKKRATPVLALIDVRTSPPSRTCGRTLDRSIVRTKGHPLLHPFLERTWDQRLGLSLRPQKGTKTRENWRDLRPEAMGWHFGEYVS